MAGCAGGEAHGGAIVFVNRRISKIIASLRKQIFVIQETFGHGVAAIRDDDHSFEGNILAEFFVKRQEDIVDQKEPVTGLFGDSCNFMRMETKIQSMQDAAGTRNADEGLQVAGMHRHHGAETVTRSQTKFRQRSRESACATVEFAIARAIDGLVWPAGNDLDVRTNP